MKMKFKKSLTIALVVLLVGVIVFGSFAIFTDRAKSNTLTISTAKFSKDGYTISREYNDVYYAAGDDVTVKVIESNTKTEAVQSVVTMSAAWVSPDSSSSPFGNANAADNATITVGSTIVDYTVNKDGTITFELPAHAMNASSKNNERNITFHIPESLKSTGNLNFTFDGVKLSQTTTMGGSGFSAEFSHDDLNASSALDFTAKVIWDFSAAQNKSVIGYLTGSNGNYGVKVEGSGAMYDWASGTASKQSSYKNSVTSVTIGDGISNIGNYAFDGFSKITSIVIPKDVTKLGTMSFGHCGKLTDITFKESAAASITFPTAGSSTGAFYVPSFLKTTFDFNGNADAKAYNWVTDNRMKVGITGATLAYDDVKVGETVDAQLGITPANHDNYQSIKYEVISGSEFAEVNADTGVVTGLKKGTATVKVTIVDANGDTVTAQGTVNVTLDTPMLAAQNTWRNDALDTNILTSVTIVDSYTPDGTESATWDASDASVPGTVTAYLSKDKTSLTIAGNGYGLIFANPDSSNAFADLNNVVSITNMDLLDTRNVTNMSGMFYGNAALSALDVGSFNVSNVTDMSGMFSDVGVLSLDLHKHQATAKDGTVYTAWNPTKAETFGSMFMLHGLGSEDRNLQSVDVTGWETNSVTDMYGMFTDCNNLTEIKGISEWNTSKVTDMAALFLKCSALESIDVSKWNTGSVETVYRMFQYCGTLKSIDISNWDMSHVTNTKEMFYGCNSFTELTLPATLSRFDEGFASSCYKLTKFTFLQPADMDITFSAAGSSTGAFSAYSLYTEKIPLGTEVISNNANVLNYSWPKNARGFTVTVDSVTGGTLTPDVTTAINGKTVTLTPAVNAGYAYNGATVSYTDKSGADKAIDLASDELTFTMPAANVKITPKWLATVKYGQAIYSVTDNSLTFVNASKLYKAGDTYNGKAVTEVYTGFETATYTSATAVPWASKQSVIKSVVVADEGIKPVSTAYWFDSFVNCSSFDVTKLDTSKVTNMGNMFHIAGKSITSTFYIGDLSGWDTSKVTNMYGMFWGAGNVATTWNIGDFGKWDVSNVTNMKRMFYYAGTGASNVTLDLSSWNTSKVTDMSEMFKGFTGLKRVYATHRFSTAAVTSSSDMFLKTSNIVGGNGTKYSSSKITKTYACVDGVDSKPGYFTNNIFLDYDSPIEVGDTVDPQLTILSTVFKNYTSIKYEIVSGSQYATIDATTGVITGKDNGSIVIKVTLGASNGDTISATANVDIGQVTVTYTVKHWQQTVTGGTAQNSTNFTLNETQTLTGTSGTSVAPAVKSYTGFTSPSKKTVTIAADGRTVVNYYYTRNSYTVTLNKGTGIASVSGAGTYKYGQLVTIDATVSSGYSWSKWSGYHSSTSKQCSFIMPASNVTDIANAESNSIAQAIYSATDNSLTFIRDRLYSAGETYNGKAVTAVYTGFESETYTFTSVPWSNVCNSVKSVYVKDRISPISTACWFNSFMNCSSFDVSNLNVSNVTNMESMFSGAGTKASTLKIIGLSSWDTSNVTSMSMMFMFAGSNASTFDIGNLSSWNTSNVTDISAMFQEAGASASTFDIGDLSNWNTSKVTDMMNMFRSAGKSAQTFNIGKLTNWNTSKVTDMQGMFANAGYSASSFILDLSKWDVSSVTTMGYYEKIDSTYYSYRGMFAFAGYEASTFSLGNLSNWNTSKVTNMACMFDGAGYSASYYLNLSSWNVRNVTDYTYFNYRVSSKVTAPAFGARTASLSLTPDSELPSDVVEGTAQIISAIPDFAKLNEAAVANAPEGTGLYGWLVDSGLAKDIVLLDDFKEILTSIYEQEPEWELVITPLYQAVEKSEEETVPTETTGATEPSSEATVATEPTSEATEPTEATQATESAAEGTASTQPQSSESSEPTETTDASEPVETQAAELVTEPNVQEAA